MFFITSLSRTRVTQCSVSKPNEKTCRIRNVGEIYQKVFVNKQIGGITIIVKLYKD